MCIGGWNAVLRERMMDSFSQLRSESRGERRLRISSWTWARARRARKELASLVVVGAWVSLSRGVKLLQKYVASGEVRRMATEADNGGPFAGS